MAIFVANTSISKSWSFLVNRVNEIAAALGHVVSTDSNAATGNAAITGTFSSNNVFTTTLSGGAIGNTQPLVMNSDLNLNGHSLIGNSQFSDASFTGNTAIVGIATIAATTTFANTLTAQSAVIFQGNTSLSNVTAKNITANVFSVVANSTFSGPVVVANTMTIAEISKLKFASLPAGSIIYMTVAANGSVVLSNPFDNTILTGNPIAPTANIGANNTQISTTEFAARLSASERMIRNRHLNSAMMVCQDRNRGDGIDYGNDPSVLIPLPTSGYVFDGVKVNCDTGVLRSTNYISTSPGGSPYRFSANVVVANTPSSSGSVTIEFPIIGTDMADLQFGTEFASPFTWRGYVNLPTGDYNISFTNAANSRTYVVPFSVSAGENYGDKLLKVTVPGDTSGTWVKDNSGVGLNVRICVAAGTSLRTNSSNNWINGNYVATNAQSNLMAAVNRRVQVCDIGLYKGNYVPIWEPLDYDLEMIACQAQYQTLVVNTQSPAIGTTTITVPFLARMRSGPATEITNNGTIVNTTIIAEVASGPESLRFQYYTDTAGGYILGRRYAMNARIT